MTAHVIIYSSSFLEFKKIQDIQLNSLQQKVLKYYCYECQHEEKVKWMISLQYLDIVIDVAVLHVCFWQAKHHSFIAVFTLETSETDWNRVGCSPLHLNTFKTKKKSF